VKTIVSSLLLAACFSGLAFAQEDVLLTVTLSAHERTAHVHLPPKMDRSKKYPLVIGYHGGGGNALGYSKQSQLFAKAEKAGFITICPEGTALTNDAATTLGPGVHRIWNSGAEYAQASGNADDVGFTRQLIARVVAEYSADPNRIYATGFSNGAQMSYRLALELSDRIAAIAPMSGGRLADNLRPSRAVAVLHFHGTADGFYPFEGGLGPHSIGRTPHVPIRQVIAAWVGFDGGPLMPRIERHSGWEVRIHEGLAPVELVLVDGLGHQIAGGSDDRLPEQAMRAAPDAVQMALEFFALHPTP
jgi:polyhydroxybutyrate depolymerase